MPSFDVVSEVDMQEMRNAVDQAMRELRSRFDFRGVDAGVSLSGSDIAAWAPDEFQVKQVVDILHDKMTRRKMDLDALDPGATEASGKLTRQAFALKQGIDRDTGRAIVKAVKNAKLKVQCQMQGDQVRIAGKKRDDLQAAIAVLRDGAFGRPLQFGNFRD